MVVVTARMRNALSSAQRKKGGVARAGQYFTSTSAYSPRQRLLPRRGMRFHWRPAAAVGWRWLGGDDVSGVADRIEITMDVSELCSQQMPGPLIRFSDGLKVSPLVNI